MLRNDNTMQTKPNVTLKYPQPVDTCTNVCIKREKMGYFIIEITVIK